MLSLRKDITPRKVVNLAASLTSYAISTVLKEPGVSGMPPAVGIEITSSCNLHCLFCPSGTRSLPRGAGYMEPGLYRKIIKELNPYLININLYFQGEPMLHPRFFEFAAMAEGTHITVSTNGHLLTDENCSRLAGSGISKLIISLDGMSEKAYSAYRSGGSAEIVISGLHRLSAALRENKSKMEVEVQFLVNRFNEGEAGDAALLANRLGFKPVLKSMQLPEGGHSADWLTSEKKYRRYHETSEGRLTVKSKFKNRCFRLWFNPVVLYTGEVVPCCFDKQGEYIMGDLNSSTFREIWNGEKFRAFRRQLLTSRRSIPICMNCTTGLNGVSGL